MKNRRKKKSKAAAGVAALLVLVLVAAIFFETVMSVKASPEMMPGIETIVNGKTLNVLELVSDYSQAELGAYVKGQEPWVKLYQKAKADGSGYEKAGFTSLEDGLSKLETKKEREEFASATATIKDSTGTDQKQFQDFQVESIIGQDGSKDPVSAPLSYQEYQEKYFLTAADNVDDWKNLQLVAEAGKTRTVSLKGHYEAAENGDYTKEELTYFPVAADDTDGKAKADYDENVYGFTIQDGGTGKPYQVEFNTVSKAEVAAAIDKGLTDEYDYANGRYGYYENIYTPIEASMDQSVNTYLAGDEVDGFIPYATELRLDAKLKTICEEKGIECSEIFKEYEYEYTVVGEKAPLTLRELDILVNVCDEYLDLNPMGEEKGWLDGYVSKSEDGTYQYSSFMRGDDGKIITEVDGKTPQFETNNMLYIEGKQMVSKEAVSKAVYEGYYFQVGEVTFSCTRTGSEADGYEYLYGGNYAALYPIGESHYKQVEKGKGHYYTSEASYKLTPGKGDYNFVEKSDEAEVIVSIDHIYYQGGFTNNDWLKRYVLHLDPGDSTGKIKDPESEEAKTAKAEFDGFTITVDTMTQKDLDDAALSLWKSEHPEDPNAVGYTENLRQEYMQKVLENYGLVYLNGAVSEVQSLAIFKGAAQKAYPMIVNSDTMLSDDKKLGDLTNSLALTLWLTSEDAGSVCADLITASKFTAANVEKELTDTSKTEKDYQDDKHFVLGNVYFFSGQNQAGTANSGDSVGFISSSLKTKFTDELTEKGFKEISEYIDTENKLRDIENASKEPEDKMEMLDETVSQARAIEYVLNYRYKRTLGEKSSIKVLDLEPAKSAGSVNVIDILQWLGYSDLKMTYLDIDKKSVTRCCDGSNNSTTGQGDLNAVIGNLFDGQAGTIWHTAYKNNGVKYHEKTDDAWHNFTVKVKEDSNIKGFVWQNRTSNESGNPRVYQYRISVSDEKNGSYTVMQEGTLPNLNSGGISTIYFDKTYKGTFVKFEVMTSSSSEGLASGAEFKLFNLDEGIPFVEIDTMTTSEFVGKTGDLNSEYDMIFMGSDTTDSGNYIFKNKTTMNGGGRISGKLYPTYRENAMKGMVYTHVGDVMQGSDRLAGLLDTDYLPVKVKSGTTYKKYFYNTDLYGLRTGIDPKTGKYSIINPRIITASWLKNTVYIDDDKKMLENYKFSIGNVGQYRRSGNDITEIVENKLMNFVKSGFPVITENDLYLLSGDKKTANEVVVDNSSYIYDFLKQASGYSNVMRKSQVEEEQGTLYFYLNLPKVKIEFENGDSGKPPIYDESTPNNMIDSKDKTLRFSFRIKDEAIVSHETEKYDCKLFVDLNTDGNFAEGENIQDIEVRDADNKLLTPVDGKYALSVNKLYYVTRALPDEYREVISWKLQIENNKNSYVRSSESGVSKIKQSADPSMNVKVLQITPVPNENLLWNGDKVNLYLNSTDFQSVLNSKTVTDSLGFGFNVTVMTTREYSNAYVANRINLDNYDMIVMGFADGSTDIASEKAANAIFDFINAGKSVLFAHDSVSFMNYFEADTFNSTVKDNEKDGASGNSPYFHHDWGVKFNKILRTVGGMDRYGIASNNSESSKILKKNNILSDTDADWGTVLDETDDMAYVANSGKSQTYGETQGYSNAQMDGAGQSTNVTRVNKGAITEYPYKIPESFKIAETHCQYYQLSMEQDDNNDGESDVVVWYCLSDGDYSKSPNDVRNNYYIYSKGNVMYTGVGHSKLNVNDNITEMKLFVNTIVAAYHSSVRQPSVNFVERNDLNAAEQSYAYYSTDSTEDIGSNILNNEQILYFKVSDKNLVNSSATGNEDRNLELRFYKEVPVGTTGAVSWADISKKSSESQEKKYLQLDGNTINGNWGSEDSGWKAKSGNVYELQIPNLEKLIRETGGGAADECKIYVTVSGKVNSYGKDVNLFANDVLTFRKQQLLDMD